MVYGIRWYGVRCMVCLLPTTYCLLPTAYCLLPTAYCLLPTAYLGGDGDEVLVVPVDDVVQLLLQCVAVLLQLLLQTLQGAHSSVCVCVCVCYMA
jgi:hypothetical protein